MEILDKVFDGKMFASNHHIWTKCVFLLVHVTTQTLCPVHR